MTTTMLIQTLPGAGGCTHQLSGLRCVNPAPHRGEGRGCVHYSTWVPDRHDRLGAGEQ